VTTIETLTDWETAERQRVVSEAYAATVDRFPVRYKAVSLDDVRDIPKIGAWVDEYHTNPSTARSLLLLGSTGTGKTHAAYAALRHAVVSAAQTRTGLWRAPAWRALTHADLIASLRPRSARDHDPEAILERYQTVELLFIDDLGAIKATEYVEEVTYRLLNARYEAMLPSVVTSNLAMPALKESIGDRIASRLAETATRVVLDGPDRRRQPARLAA
jgi:DNA replication protein DnaC